jgi:hypothetical protein
MFKKLASSKALRCGILLVLVLALLITTFVVTNAALVASASPVHSSYQVADGPLSSICVSSSSSTTLCLPSIHSMGSWGG